MTVNDLLAIVQRMADEGYGDHQVVAHCDCRLFELSDTPELMTAVVHRRSTSPLGAESFNSKSLVDGLSEADAMRKLSGGFFKTRKLIDFIAM